MGNSKTTQLHKMVIVSKCIFSDSEMISDAFETTEEYDGVIVKCQSAMIDQAAMKFDIGDADDVDDQDETVNNVVKGFEMTSVTLKKGEFQAYIKKFMGKVKTHLDEKNPERTAAFMKGATACVKYLLGKFDDLEFYLGSEDPTMDGHIGIACWDDPETQTAPSFYFFKDALKTMKY